MTTGRPVRIKCPKCKRGKYGYSPQIRGVEGVGDRVKKGRRRIRLTRCLDCGHEWMCNLW